MHKRVFFPQRRSPLRWLIAGLALLAVLILVSGCGLDRYDRPDTARYVSQIHSLSHEVRFAPTATVPNAEETARLDLFMADARPGRHDRVLIASAGPLATVRGRAVADRLMVQGVAARLTTVPPGRPEDRLVVTVERTIDTPVACLGDGIAMDRTKPSWIPDRPATLPPGCAVAGSLAGMLANPDDLRLGTPAGPADGPGSIPSVERYRAGEIRPVERTQTD